VSVCLRTRFAKDPPKKGRYPFVGGGSKG